MGSRTKRCLIRLGANARNHQFRCIFAHSWSGRRLFATKNGLVDLRANGREQAARKGNHIHFKHPVKVGRVTVPHPNRDLPIGTPKSIERQAQIKLR
jgi:predicted RNA binding protein YcfA (HicA-like mRNA interferase family)